MPGALERIVRSGAAYQAAAFLSAGLAFFTFAAYSKVLGQDALGVADLILAWLIGIAIFARLGFGEALLRHWFTATDRERPQLQRSIQRGVVIVSGLIALVVFAFAEPISTLLPVFDKPPASFEDPWLIRIAATGLFLYCNLDTAQTLLRARDDRRTYLLATVSNVLLTIALSMLLVVVLDQGVRGYLIGNYGASGIILLGLWAREIPVFRGRVQTLPAFVNPATAYVQIPATEPVAPASATAPDPGEALAPHDPLAAGIETDGAIESDEQRRAASRGDTRALLRFGLPTIPTDAAIFGFNLLDRTILAAMAAASLGQFSYASKIASGVILMARAFQLAFPPLAYSIKDPAHASTIYASALRGYAVVLGGTVAGVALCAPWTVEVIVQYPVGDPNPRPGVIEILPLLAAAWAMWGVIPVMTTIAGRLGAPGLAVPAAVFGLLVNLVALVLLVPPYGAHGAAAALVIAYVVLIATLNLLTRRYFPVAFDWPRIGAAIGLCVATCLLAGPLADAPDLGWGPAGIRLVMFAALIALLWRFALEQSERDELRSVGGRLARIGRRG